MPDENLLATLENTLRQSREARTRRASRLADLEAEAERVRTELNEIDAVISHTENAMFRILSSMFGAAQSAAPPSDAEIEFALRRDAVTSARVTPQSPTHTPYGQSQPSAREQAFRHHIPPIRAGLEPKRDRFFEH